MRFLLLFSVCQILIGCSQFSNCKVEDGFSQKFIESFLYVRETEYQKEFLVEKRLNAIIFLSVVTNKESSIDDPHHPQYQSEAEFDAEINHWEDWYRQNKCKYTIREADSLVDLYNQGVLSLE